MVGTRCSRTLALVLLGTPAACPNGDSDSRVVKVVINSSDITRRKKVLKKNRQPRQLMFSDSCARLCSGLEKHDLI